jgi:hypothetical protein
MTNSCRHQWDENGAVDGLVLASCMLCSAKQWHVTDLIYIGDGTHTIKDKINRANQLNKKDGLELIKVGKQTIVDTSLTNEKYFVKEGREPMDTVIKKPATSGPTQVVISNDPPVPPEIPETPHPAIEDSRILRMRLNTGNSERFDKLAQQVIEDVKTMAWSAALRKNGIPVGSAGRLRRRWEHMGLIAKATKQEVKKVVKKEKGVSKYDHLLPQILEDLKVMNCSQCEKKNGLPGQTLFSLLKKWKLCEQIPIDYEPPIRGMTTQSIKRSKNTKKSTAEVQKKVEKDTLPGYLCPYCETNWSQADALIKHLEAVHHVPSKMTLPPWNEAWGDAVKIKWLEITWEIWRAGKYGLLNN